MSTITPKPLGQGQLGTGSTTIYTVPASTTGVVRTLTICNNDTVARTMQLCKVPNGGSLSDATAIIPAGFVIEAGEVVEDDAVRTLAAGDSIRGLADVANKVTVTIDGAEETA